MLKRYLLSTISCLPKIPHLEPKIGIICPSLKNKVVVVVVVVVVFVLAGEEGGGGDGSVLVIVEYDG